MGVVLNESFRTTVIKEWASGPCYPKGKGWIQESPRFTHRVKWPRIWPCQYSSFRSKSPSTVSRFHLTVAWYIQEISHWPREVSIWQAFARQSQCTTVVLGLNFVLRTKRLDPEDPHFIHRTERRTWWPHKPVFLRLQLASMGQVKELADINSILWIKPVTTRVSMEAFRRSGKWFQYKKLYPPGKECIPGVIAVSRGWCCRCV